MMADEAPQLPEGLDTQGHSGTERDSALTHAGSDRQALKLLLGFACVAVIALVFVLVSANAAVRRTIILFYVIGAAALLLMARYIVYSYKREKAQIDAPYRHDHRIE